MEMIIPATEARNKFAEILDSALTKPVRINRRKTEYVTLDTQQLSDILTFTPVLEGEPNDYVIFLKELPQILGFGNTKEEAITDLFLAIKDYTGIYLENMDDYYSAKNTKGQSLHVLALDNMPESKFRELVNAKLA